MNSAPQKILYLQHATEIGGSCMSLLYLIQQMDRSRYEPLVACFKGADAVTALYEENGISTVQQDLTFSAAFTHTTAGWWPLSNPAAVRDLLNWIRGYGKAQKVVRETIRSTQPDLVHLNSLTLAPYARESHRLGIPTVLQVRESVRSGHIGLRRRWLRNLIRKDCDAVIFISEDDRRRLAADDGAHVVPNFVDFHYFDRAIDQGRARKDLQLPGESKVVLYLGGLHEIKGIFPLLRAIPRVRSEVDNVIWLMPGALAPMPEFSFRGRVVSLAVTGHWRYDGERATAILERLRASGADIRLLAYRTDIPSLIAASDLVVFPSTSPHFARPVVEAGAMGKPVVASRIGGVEELVVDGETGLLVAPGNAKDLVTTIVRVLKDKSLCERLGEQGYVAARRLFDANANAQKVFEIYAELDHLAGGAPPRGGSQGNA